MPVVTGWVLAEDAALKEYLQGFIVSDATAGAGRPVKVWYRNPEAEERPREYPYITIDLIDVAESPEGGRHMVNRIKVAEMEYAPPNALPAAVAGKTMLADRPVPIDLDYQVTSYSRLAMHDRALLAYLFRKFPGKYGALYIPGDNTARTMQSLGGSSSSDVDQDGKRLYRRSHRVRIFSEMWPAAIAQVANLSALNLNIRGGSTINSTIGTHLDCDAE